MKGNERKFRRIKIVVLVCLILSITVGIFHKEIDDYIWRSKLVLAASADDYETGYELLKERGHDINKKGGGVIPFNLFLDEFMDRTPLYEATTCCGELVIPMLEYGADPNYDASNWDDHVYASDYYPVGAVLVYENDWTLARTIVERLLQMNVVTEGKNHNDLLLIAEESPLDGNEQYSAEKAHEITELYKLCEKNSRDKNPRIDGSTPLSLAREVGNIELQEYLQKKD